MWRRLFTLAAGVSAVLCVAVCVLWAGSYVQPRVKASRGGYHLEADRGQIRFGWFVSLASPPEATTWEWLQSLPMAAAEWRGFGFAWGEAAYVDLYSIGSPTFVHDYWRVRRFQSPAWAVAVLFALPPAWWLLCWRRERRAAARLASRLCLACGYDLRATPGRCPECGAASPREGNPTFAFRS